MFTMERVSVLCLLLLLCSLTGAELQDNAITEQRKASPEGVNVAQQPPSDLLAVLRDMSAKLVGLQVKMEALNQRQVKMEAQNREQAAKLMVLEKQTSQVDTQQARRVAFSASLIASGGGYTGPFNSPTPLVFRNVVTNIGNAYSPNTGFFTAPVRGAYHFEFHIYNIMDGYLGSGAYLVNNGQTVCIAYEFQSNGAGKSSSGVTLLLRAGDVVALHQWANTKIYDDGNRHSMFSGHLLFPM